MHALPRHQLAQSGVRRGDEVLRQENVARGEFDVGRESLGGSGDLDGANISHAFFEVSCAK